MKARGILIGGLIAGTLDISYACIASKLLGGNGPIVVFQSVAGGLLGMKTYDGGYGTAALGLLLHFTIALTAATVFYFASRKIPILTQHPVIFGLLYGMAIYFFMYFFVLPVSAFPHKLHFTIANMSRNLGIHMLGIGLPISLANKRFSATS